MNYCMLILKYVNMYHTNHNVYSNGDPEICNNENTNMTDIKRKLNTNK